MKLKELVNSKFVISNDNSKRVLVVYHREDNDGLFSGAIIMHYLHNDLKVDIDDIFMIGEDYSTLKDITTDDIDVLRKNFKQFIMTDLAFNDHNIMKYVKNSFGNQFVWIDHHGPAIGMSVQYKYDDVNGCRGTDRSAILQAYKYCYDPFDEEYNSDEFHGNIPMLFQLLSAWDSFNFGDNDLDYVSAINVGVNEEYNLNLDNIYQLVHWLMHPMSCDHQHEEQIDELYNIGKIVNKANARLYANLIKSVGDASFTLDNGEAVTVLVMQGPTNSLAFKTANTPHGAVFKRLPSGGWVVSLYNVSTEDKFHCGEYLKKKYKGGGHVGAAGCQLTEKQMMKIFKNKII